MQLRKRLLELSPIYWVIIIAATLKFAMHLIIAPGYGFFLDELYTMALSRHLAFGYVDLPPLVPAIMALSRAVLGESLLAMHIVPALAGTATLVFVCLIAKEFGGKAFAVTLCALGFIIAPLWLSVDSIFCYDSIDQLVLAGFLYTLVRFLRSGNRKLWILLGLIAGIACLTKMTMLFIGPGFLIALLVSRYRKDLLTLWPWLGAALCLLLVSPYLLWQIANHWPTLEYWNAYGTIRVYEASIPQYFMNIQAVMHPFLLPLWVAGLYRIFRRLNGANYSFLGLMFLFTVALMFYLHASVRMLAELFMPLIAAGAVFVEELLSGARWKMAVRALATAYLVVGGVFILPWTLPIVPMDRLSSTPNYAKYWYQSIREFNGGSSYMPLILTGRLGWEEFVQDIGGVYNQLPAQERAVAGIYTDWYSTAGAVDLYGPRYGLPHAVSGSLTYYLWGPGYSWDVMLIVTTRTNQLGVFFDECTQKGSTGNEYEAPRGRLYIFECKNPKIPAEKIWSSLKNYR
jgi:4-amino-4-deoxy-L-arabinose transferase-like glycosyltransferase